MSARLVIRLAAGPAVQPVTWLLTDASGAFEHAGRAESLEALPQDITRNAQSSALIVPGCEVLCRRLELPARTEAQARAAAPYLMEDYLACAPERMHFALGPARRDSLRSIFAVDAGRLQAWLDALAGLSLDPDLVLADYLLLGAREGEAVLLDDGAMVTAALGPEEGFSSERDLARLALADGLARAEIKKVHLFSAAPESLAPPEGWGERQVAAAPAPDDEAGLGDMAGRLDMATVTLRQGNFARRRAMAGVSLPAFAGLAAGGVFIAALAALLLYLEGARYARLAAQADARAERIFQTVVGEARRVVNPVQQLAAARGELTGESSSAGFLELANMLSAAVAAVEGVRVQSLRYTEESGRLHARIAYRDFDDLEPIKQAVAGRGGRLVEEGARQENGRVLGNVTVEMAQ